MGTSLDFSQIALKAPEVWARATQAAKRFAEILPPEQFATVPVEKSSWQLASSDVQGFFPDLGAGFGRGASSRHQV